jgi:hypothetical protein
MVSERRSARSVKQCLAKSKSTQLRGKKGGGGRGQCALGPLIHLFVSECGDWLWLSSGGRRGKCHPFGLQQVVPGDDAPGEIVLANPGKD